MLTFSSVDGNGENVSQDVRWKQRFDYYCKAVGQLTRFIEKGKLNELENQGLVQCFEYTYELAWNTIKDFFEAQGEVGILGSRDAFRLAFQRGLVENGDAWMEMIRSRQRTSHSYNEEVVAAITHDITTVYFAEFVKLRQRLEGLAASDT